MIAALTHQAGKKLRFFRSFLSRRLIHVNLQILYQCNFRCRICDFWKEGYRDKPRLSAAEVAVIAEKLNEIGPQIISIGGGEPLLHPELVELVRALARYHFPVMISNGSLMTRELATQLWQAGMVEISVSLDYADPQKHDQQRGFAGAHARGIEALRILQATRTHPEQRVNLISVIMDDNEADLERLLRLSRELGISYLVTLYSHSRGAKPQRVSSPALSDHLLDLKRRYREFVALRGYLARFSEAVAQGGIAPCDAGRTLCNIDSQGNVTLCIDRLDDPVGNILTDTMPDLVAQLRQRHQENACRDCWTSCRGSIETILYGHQRLLNALDYFQMTRPVPLSQNF